MTITGGHKTVLGVGSPVVDRIAHVSEEFLDSVEGEKGGMELVDAEALEHLMAFLPNSAVKAPGGSAGNTVFALARLAVPSRLLGVVGNDAEGKYYKDVFTQTGGDASQIGINDGLSTARCLSLVTPDGQRTMRTHLGAASSMMTADITPACFSECRHVHVEGYLIFNWDLLIHVLETATSAGCGISLDLGSFEIVGRAKDRLPGLLKKYVDIVFANEEEAEAYAGSYNPDDCLQKLSEGCEVAAIKLGADGALLRNAKDTCHVSAIPAHKVVDTTGAGDLWAAGFLYGLINGCSLKQCGQFGSILGAAAVQQEGGSIPAKCWPLITPQLAA